MNQQILTLKYFNKYKFFYIGLLFQKVMIYSLQINHMTIP